MRKIKKKRYILLFIITVLALLPIYAFSIEPNLFVVTHHRLNPEASSNHGIVKIVQISDLHLKKFNDRAQRIAEQVNKLQPDIVVFTGDSVDKAEQIDGYDRFLSLLDRQTAKYAILGNWEYKSRVDLERLTQIYAAYNCRLLVNESILYKQGDRNLLITGIDDLVSEPNLTKSLQNINPNPNHLLLAHSPAYADVFSADELRILSEYKPQYMLTGHTHGGQLSFFGFAPILPPRSGNYVSGWYQTNSISIYVSRGLGVSVLPMRIGTIPEIAYFEWVLKS
ncbi:metallophosphoesterase [Pseudanabaena sp. UWO311]|uniref:metallophosphoesterase n=1 Tax=Pseudanabaena sp. UWO311 TaxID=2487337 RepID=UPI00115920BE|nr:metallophosphoesterase [Pseudanabaena sp. UWO311]TYQ24175.1 metallophosphoesterase [Pseudanabaena sp. UWO311]